MQGERQRIWSLKLRAYGPIPPTPFGRGPLPLTRRGWRRFLRPYSLPFRSPRDFYSKGGAFAQFGVGYIDFAFVVFGDDALGKR